MKHWLTTVPVARKSTLLISIQLILACVTLFGVNELSKATLFTFLEREHKVLAGMVADKLEQSRFEDDERIQREMVFAVSQDRELMGIEGLIKETRKQAETCVATVNPLEKLLFQIVGFGAAVDLCHKSIADTNKALAIINDYQSQNISNHEQFVDALVPVIAEVSENSEGFAGLIPAIVSFVEGLIIVNILLFSAVSIFLVFTIMQDLRTRISYLSERIGGICSSNDLSQRIEHVEHQKDEIGQVSVSFNSMLSQFESVVIKLRSNSEHLSNASATLYSKTEVTKSQINTQHIETDQVAAAVTEMASAIEEISSNTNRAAESAQDGFDHAITGRDAVNKAISSVDNLAQELDKMASVVSNLDTDTKTIGGVLDVIRGIAEQTNLLALNAAIEAARAGDQGRGFAVVADEVRSLASRTQESTEEIHQMIEKLQEGAREAVSAMQRNKQASQETINEINIAGDTLSDISGATEMIRDMGVQIATATEQQTSVVNEVHKNIINIKQASESTSKAAIDIHHAAEQVSKVTVSMTGTVNDFKTNNRKSYV